MDDNRLNDEVDNLLKSKLSEEEWKVYSVISNDQDNTDELIEEIGEEKLSMILDKINMILEQEYDI